MDKELADVLKAVNGKDGKMVKIASDREPVEAMSTGSISIDRSLGIGGLPKGRIIEIYGPEASGKTTIVLGMIAAAQKNNVICAFLDMEHALTPGLAVGCGVDMDKLIFSQPNYGEQCLDFAEKLIKTGKIGLLVIDSVAAMTPKAELDGEMEDQQMGAQARMIGKGVRKLVAAISDTNTVMIFINQLREKLGIMFGNPEVTPGGKAIKFAASVRLEVRRKESITDGKKTIGNNLRVKVVKNKVDMPGDIADVQLYFGKGVDNSKDILKIAVEVGVVTKSGSFYTYKDTKGNGLDAFLKIIKDTGVYDEIEVKTREEMIKEQKIIDRSSDDEFDETDDSNDDSKE